MKIAKLVLILLSCAQVNGIICSDSDWQDPQQLGCDYYSSSGLCQDYKFTDIGAKYSGSAYNFPELNCCACGKGRSENYYKEPDTTPYTCVQKAINNKSEQVVQYCNKAKNRF